MLSIRFLLDNGYMAAARAAEEEAGISLSKVDVADNIDMSSILQEYEEYVQLKFGRPVKLTRKVSGGGGGGAGGAGGGGAAMLEFVQQPGELVFVPRGWWHCTVTVEASVALTQNQVQPSDAAAALRELAEAPGQERARRLLAEAVAERHSDA